ncbi:MAG: VanZ family protein [Pseudomonadota bacterium]
MDTNLRRTILWTLVAAYTFVLPDAIIVYDTIAKHFTVPVARKVPIVITLFFGLSYIVFGLITQKNVGYHLFILPCVFIVLAVVFLEPNPNKHIHMPEYMVMAWLLYEAFSVDYRGSGIFLLVFLCASMLGIVDELAQGIYPGRYYGWIDMGINSASSIIGVFILMGLKNRPKTDWAWTNHLLKRNVSLVQLAFGAMGAVLLCVYLFDVQAARVFRGVYPRWLSIWNCAFLTLSPAIVLYDRYRFRGHGSPGDEKGSAFYANEVTADLWVVIPLVILFAMHAIAAFAAFSGMPFA